MALSNDSFLRRSLLIDAAASGATCALLIFGSNPLSSLFSLPQWLLLAAGLTMVPFVALLAWLMRQATPPAPLVKAVIAMNLFWTSASFGLLLSGAFAPTALGTAFVAAQAIAVFAFAMLQSAALKRLRAAVPAA